MATNIDNFNKLIKKLKIPNNKCIIFQKNKVLIGGYNVIGHIFPVTLKNTKLENFDLDKIVNFIKELKTIRLNHTGMGYNVADAEEEMKRLGKAVKCNLYKDPDSDNKATQTWLFAGNKNKLEQMYEFVLYKSKNKKPSTWRPHFQIDYDTPKTEEEIVALSNKYFGRNIFSWKLHEKGYGTLLLMGTVCKIGDTKIILGIGTNLRNPKIHRETMIKIN